MRHILAIPLAFCFVVMSVTIMSYVALTTPLGPWIAPTLALCGVGILKNMSRQCRDVVLIYAISAGSIGGIVATGIAFTFPALHFLLPDLFAQWLSSEVYFCCLLASITMAAGGLGVWCAGWLAPRLIDEQQLPFPIGALTYKIISAGNSVVRVRDLVIGFSASFMCGILRDGFCGMHALMARSIQLTSAMQWGLMYIPAFRLDIWPTLWAIGFIAGRAIALPLAVGLVTKLSLLDPMRKGWFVGVSSVDFMFAFCSGIILFSVFSAVFSLCVSVLYKALKMYRGDSHILLLRKTGFKVLYKTMRLPELLIIGLVCGCLFSWYSFPLYIQSYLFGCAMLCAYQIAVIAGKVGIAPLGRFATFVMLPAMALFHVDFVQVVLISVFIEVCGGVTADALFNLRMATAASVDRFMVQRYQYLGVILSALVVGGIFLVLIRAIPLGSEQLFAYKAQNRYLLITALTRGGSYVSWCIVMAGLVFAFLLDCVGVNSSLVLGGLLMDVNLSLGLIIGGICSSLVRNKELWEPFWSGVFAADSLWILVRALWLQ